MTLSRPAGPQSSPEDRFRAVFSTHYPAVFGYAARRLGRDEAADAAAEVFTVAWRRLSALPAEPETLPWLYGVARRVVANAARSKRRRERLAARAAALADPPTAGSADDLQPAFERLSEKDREVLRLAAWEGLDPRQMAAVLGCSPNAAAVRLHRARRRLEAALEPSRGER
jgi:RNA polymerase sigma-70 factor (ECF subfamily)